MRFFAVMFGGVCKRHYICNVFFMVLDLRLTKVDCRETINFFCICLKKILPGDCRAALLYEIAVLGGVTVGLSLCGWISCRWL